MAMPANWDENRISAVLGTTTQIVLSEMLTINMGGLSFSRRRVTYPCLLLTQVFSEKRVIEKEVAAAGIAPASQIPQADTQHIGCIDASLRCLHTVCTDLALRALVASWHRLTPDVRERIMSVASGTS
jgi:hypothetical protein